MAFTDVEKTTGEYVCVTSGTSLVGSDPHLKFTTNFLTIGGIERLYKRSVLDAGGANPWPSSTRNTYYEHPLPHPTSGMGFG